MLQPHDLLSDLLLDFIHNVHVFPAWGVHTWTQYFRRFLSGMEKKGAALIVLSRKHLECSCCNSNCETTAEIFQSYQDGQLFLSRNNFPQTDSFRGMRFSWIFLSTCLLISYTEMMDFMKESVKQKLQSILCRKLDNFKGPF